MRRRLPRNFNLEERLERYAKAIEFEPAKLQGRWAEACHPLPFASPSEASVRPELSVASKAPACPERSHSGASLPAPSSFDEVHLDLGCGKGDWIVGLAKRRPQTLFVGMDFDPVCITYTAQAIMEADLNNAVVAFGAGAQAPQLFGKDEISCIYLNFPTPFPRKKDAHLRLVALERLLEYHDILVPGGKLWLRTDSQPLRDFALGQLELAGYRLEWNYEDERAVLPDVPVTYYEERLSAQGAHVLSLAATPPQAKPAQIRQVHSLSLIDYLPDNLSDLSYIPYGMEWTVETIRRRKRRLA